MSLLSIGFPFTDFVLPYLAATTAGRSACNLCAAGTFASTLIAATSCSTCDATRGQLCLLGAAFPAPNKLKDATATSVGAKPLIADPLRVLVAANEASVADLGMRIALIAAPIVLAIIALAVAAEKSAAVKSCLSCGRAVNWQVLDRLFRDAHFVSLGNYARLQQTALGAAMTVAGVLSFVAAGTILGVNNLLYPTYVSTVNLQVCL